MMNYFKALRAVGVQGTFMGSGDSVYIITTGINWQQPKPANDNG